MAPDSLMTEDGSITISSAYSIDETIGRFEAALKARGVTLFAKIDHAAGATAAGMPLRPTFLFIFGTPQAGTPLMQANQRIGIDLPLKALIWQDADGTARLTYNDPAWLAARHRLGSGTEAAVEALGKALAALAKEATSA
jgi:uncharacterized protein (DUF302 family)